MATLQDVQQQVDRLILAGMHLQQEAGNRTKLETGRPRPPQGLRYVLVRADDPSPIRPFGLRVHVTVFGGGEKPIMPSSPVNSVGVSIGTDSHSNELRDDACRYCFGASFVDLADGFRGLGPVTRTAYQIKIENPQAAVPAIEHMATLWARQDRQRAQGT
jgi:hypothetical protein